MAQGKTKGLQKKAGGGGGSHAASRAAAKTKKGGRSIPPKQKVLVQKDALRKVCVHRHKLKHMRSRHGSSHRRLRSSAPCRAFTAGKGS